MTEHVPPGTKNYRTDIDGLRALAVLLVVGRHLRVSRLGGGFVGVDVFFVISGYLISSMIMPEIAAGTFSLVGFYERRIRRIYPALALMLAVSTGLAWHYLFPVEMVSYARSLRGALFGYSNVIFWNWVGYFDGPNELKPLLHTWSLGVEEQFYLFFPLALMLLRRLGQRWVKFAVWGIAGASFGWACWMITRTPATAFFYAPLRAWELLAGVVVAQRYVPAIQGAVGRNVAGLAGLGMILVPGLMYTARTPFPGLAAVFPCVGAALILAAGETGGSAVGWILSRRPMVFVGLISYSLYLWHWPVQVFWDYAHLLEGRREDDLRAEGIVFAVSFAAAVLSWWMVERPFRSGRLRVERKTLFQASSIAAAYGLLVSVGLIYSHGAPLRFSAETVKAASYLGYDSDAEDRWDGCAFGNMLPTLGKIDAAKCLPYSEGKRHYLLVGDSHAADLWPGLSRVFPDLDIGQLNMAECPMLAGAETAPRACGMVSRFIYQEYLPTHPVDGLLVSYRWLDSSVPDVDALVAYGKAHGVRVILFGPTVEYTLPLPRLLAMAAQDGHGLGEVLAHAERRPWEMDQKLARMARERWGVEYVSFYDNVCGGGSDCPVYAGQGVPLEFDANHFTGDGSRVFAETLREKGPMAGGVGLSASR